MKLLLIGIVGVGLFASASTRAAEPEKKVAIAGNLSASHGVFKAEGTARSSGTAISITPTLDVLVAGGLSLGVAANFLRASSEVEGASNDHRTTYFQPSAQVGYFVPIGDHAAFWPVARAGYGFGWHTSPTGDTTSRTLELSLIPQVLLRPTQSFFVRFAPGVLAYRTTSISGGPGAGIVGISPVFAIGVGVML